MVISTVRFQVERQKAYRPVVSPLHSGEFSGVTTTKADFDRKKVRIGLHVKNDVALLGLCCIVTSTTRSVWTFLREILVHLLYSGRKTVGNPPS